MSLIDYLRQANSYFGVNDFIAAKECLEKALNCNVDEQTRNMIYEQLSVCCIHLNESEKAIVYLEFLAANDEYDGIDDVYLNLARMYSDAGRFDDMYNIAKKISTRPHQPGSLKQPEQLFYEIWRKQNEPVAVELERQRNYEFEFGPKISVVVPVFNVEIRFLIEMLDSVCSQTYSNWELCIADGNSVNEEIRETICKYAEKDSRIRYIFLDENLGISENTNAAIRISDGEYIFFLDQDDVLPENALFEFVMALDNHVDTEFIFSDHDHIVGNVRTAPLFKPDWSTPFLEQQNCILHPVILKREFLLKIGLLKKEYDRAQDTDLLLRVTENTCKILHIPKILYHWRIHADSVNFLNSYVEDADVRIKLLNMKAEHLTRKNILWKESGINDLELVIRGNPKVSVIIVNKDNFRYLKRCIDSIGQYAGYENYEILIIDKGSKEEETLQYYKVLKENITVKILYRNALFENNSNGYASDYNYGAENASGEYFIFMSAVCEIRDNYWIYIFLQIQQYSNIGLTGCGINYADESGNLVSFSGIQLIGKDRGLDRIYSIRKKKVILCPDESLSEKSKLSWRSVTALDSACVMIKKELFIDLGGFDLRFPNTLFIFDLCLKSRVANLYNVWINALVLNYVQKKDIYFFDAKQNFDAELESFNNVWEHELIKDDPFMNINLSVNNYEKNGCLFNIQNEVRK